MLTKESYENEKLFMFLRSSDAVMLRFSWGSILHFAHQGVPLRGQAELSIRINAHLVNAEVCSTGKP